MKRSLLIIILFILFLILYMHQSITFMNEEEKMNEYDIHQVEDMYNHSMKAIQKSHDHNIGLTTEDYNVLVKILNDWREFNEQ